MVTIFIFTFCITQSLLGTQKEYEIFINYHVLNNTKEKKFHTMVEHVN